MGAFGLTVYFFMVIIGFTIAGLVGFGANVLTLPILSCFFSIRQLVAVFAMVSFANGTYRVIENRKGIIITDFVRMLLVSGAGTVIGIVMFRQMPEQWLRLLLGIFIIVIALYNLFFKAKTTMVDTMPAKERLLKKICYRIILLGGGIFQGSFICGGPLYVIYCNHYYGHNRLHFRGMQFGIIFVNNVMIFISYVLSGVYHGGTLSMSLLGLVALMISFVISGAILKKVNDTALSRMVQIVLLISGGSMAFQAISHLL